VVREESRSLARPRIALVAHDIAPFGGMDRALTELIIRGGRDLELVVFSASLDPALRSLVSWRRVAVPDRPVALKFPLFFLLAGSMLARDRFDLVCTVGAIVPNRSNVVSVHFCHAGFRKATGSLARYEDAISRRINTGIVRLLSLAAERWCYREGRANALAAVSEGVARELSDYFPGVPVTVVPNGVDLERFAPAEGVDRMRLRAELGFSQDDVVALFVGGDWARKGLHVAIEGLACAKIAGASALRLCVVGRGDERQLSTLARSLGVEGSVTFSGARSDSDRFCRAADVFVLPTLYEAFSLVMLEALASGLPIVTTRVNGTEELFRNGAPGILVERTPAAVADALVRLVKEPGLREEMGAAARAVASEYTWERSTEAMLEVFRDLMSQGKSRGSGSPLSRPSTASRG
jgi:UDP-glucose:(heptosyl)LPS alpha-1,3-glucosyltransferase